MMLLFKMLYNQKSLIFNPVNLTNLSQIAKLNSDCISVLQGSHDFIKNFTNKLKIIARIPRVITIFVLLRLFSQPNIRLA